MKSQPRLHSFTSPRKRKAESSEDATTVLVTHKGQLMYPYTFQKTTTTTRVGIKIISNQGGLKHGVLVANGVDSTNVGRLTNEGFTFKIKGMKTVVENRNILMTKKYKETLEVNKTEDLDIADPKMTMNVDLENTEFHSGETGDIISVFGGVLEIRPLDIQKSNKVVNTVKLGLSGGGTIIRFIVDMKRLPFAVGDTIEIKNALVDEYNNQKTIKTNSTTVFFGPGPSWTTDVADWANKFLPDHYVISVQATSVHDVQNVVLLTESGGKDDTRVNVVGILHDINGDFLRLKCGHRNCLKSVRQGESSCPSGHNETPVLDFLITFKVKENLEDEHPCNLHFCMFNEVATKFLDMSPDQFNDLTLEAKDVIFNNITDKKYSFNLLVKNGNKNFPSISIKSINLV
jgi:hypothetical protein